MMAQSFPPGSNEDPDVLSGAAWDAFCESLRQAGQRVLGPEISASPRARAEGFRYLTRFLAAGNVGCVAHDDADYPVFGRLMDVTMPWGLDNPDCLYLYAPLRGGAEYQVFGNRGSANHVDFQVNFGHFADGEVSAWGTIASIDAPELETDERGEFQLHLGGEERSGNWLPLADDAQFLLVRQYFNDWTHERPADLLIERVGAAYPAPPPTTKWIGEHLEKLSRWLTKGGLLWETMSRGFVGMAPNTLIMQRAELAGERAGMRGQSYGMGNFHCRPGEAVLLEFRVPECRHWGTALANEYWECIEFATRQSSLNGAQAHVDSDGFFRAVIAHDDPGVANWLDAAGYHQGTLTVRFLDADVTPDVHLERGPIEEILKRLPTETRTVDGATRAAVLAERRRAVYRRYRR